MIWKRKKKTPLQKLLLESGLLPKKGPTPRQLAEWRAELEWVRVHRPDFYQALVESNRRTAELAEAMYPPPEEQKRLVELKNPQDQRRPGERADEA